MLRSWLPPLGNQQSHHPFPDVVADLPNALDGLALWIGERPVLALESGHVGTGIATTHRDDEVGTPGEPLGEFLRLRRRQVDSNLAHDVNNFRVDVLSGLGTCRDCARGLGRSRGIEERRRHLRTTGVVNAGKDNGLHADTRTGRAGTNHRKSAVAAAAPSNCAAMNPGASVGRIPEKVSVIALAIVTAGFANDVEAVNQ